MLDLAAAELERHSVSISGHQTSISIERGFWHEFQAIAQRRKLSVAELIRQLDEARGGSLSGAMRSYVLEDLQARLRVLETPDQPHE